MALMLYKLTLLIVALVSATTTTLNPVERPLRIDFTLAPVNFPKAASAKLGMRLAHDRADFEVLEQMQRGIQQMQAESLVQVVVALGRRAHGVLAQHIGAQVYVQMGTSPRDLLSALQAAVANGVSGAQAEGDLLTDADTVLDKPALIDF